MPSDDPIRKKTGVVDRIAVGVEPISISDKVIGAPGPVSVVVAGLIEIEIVWFGVPRPAKRAGWWLDPASTTVPVAVRVPLGNSRTLPPAVPGTISPRFMS